MQFGKPSLICDFLKLYRYLIDGFIIDFAKRIRSKDFVINDEVYSSNRRGKRQYLNERLTDEFLRGINTYFRSKVDVPRIRNGKEQEIETLIGEEALLLAKYLRNEVSCWVPRVVNLG